MSGAGGACGVGTCAALAEAVCMLGGEARPQQHRKSEGGSERGPPASAIC